MPKFSAVRIINALNSMSKEDKSKKAQSNTIIKEEINNVMEDTKISLYNQDREYAVKYALWQGLLNQYGLFGTRRSTKRLFGKNKNINYYDDNYKHGDLISVDFGTSNLDKEFSFTHTAIVLKSYTDYIVVIPTTSCKDGRLETKPQDEQDDTLIITSKDFPDIESDSYVMLYQIRSVSKNRIQKKIGTISGKELLVKIDYKIDQIFANSLYEKFDILKQELHKKMSENEELHIEIQQLQNELEKCKNMLTHQDLCGNIKSTSK